MRPAGRPPSRPTKSVTVSPVAFSTLETLSVVGQRGLPSRVMRLLLLKEVASSLARRARPEAVSPGLAARAEDPILAARLFGLDFPNPIGLAAGFDKSAEAFAPALSLGFGFVEVGSVTPLPQSGNPRPRLFRLAEDRAVINRMGFNNDGLAAVRTRLAGRDGAGGIVGVNLGKNRDS